MADNLIEPTEEEKRNGWTAKTLTDYVRRQEAAQKGLIGFNPAYRLPPRPKAANYKYDPHRWRR